MKKYMILAVSALLFVACSNDGEIDNWNGEIRLCTTTQLQTRATQELQSTQFDAGEEVDIFINENVSSSGYYYPQPIEYTADGNGGLNTYMDTPRYPTSGNDVNIFGVYPNNKAFNISDPYSFEVQYDQSDDDNYKASDLMLGAAANPVSRQAGAVAVTFKHMLSKININLTIGAGLNADSLVNATVLVLNTMPSTTFNVQGAAIGDPVGGAQSDVINIIAGNLPDNSAAISGDALSHSAIIIPQRIEGGTEFIQIVLHWDDPSYTELTYSLPETEVMEFESGKVYTYNLTVNRYEITATTTITDWVTGATITGDATN